MRIAICDDESICRAKILNIATDYAEERSDQDVTFHIFSTPEELLSDAAQNGFFDIYILDIVMPGMNGIQLGQSLRDAGMDGKIIYLTSSKEYALESFRVRAFDYILKPIQKETFFSVMDEAVSSIHIKKDRVLLVKTKDNNARITFDSILFAERKGRAIQYHLTGGKTVESTTLRTSFTAAMTDLISDKRFHLCGAGLIANLHHISMVENESVIFLDSKRVFLGKRACRELRTAWNVYWISAEGGK